MVCEAIPITEYRKSWAIVIGIDNYRYMGKLGNAVNDAEELALTLKDIGFDQCIELYDEDANKESIISLFVDDLPGKIKEKDRLLIFFSGHGMTIKSKRDGSPSGYIVPFDARKSKPSSLIEFQDIVIKSIRNLSAKHILFLMDCCFSGLATNFRNIPLEEVLFPPLPISSYIEMCLSKQCFQIITAGQNDALVSDNSIYQDHSPFTGAIIQGLKTWEADLSHDGILTATELGTYLVRKVPDVANVYGQKQKPVSNKVPGGENGEFVIMVSKDAVKESISDFQKRMNAVSLKEQIRSIR
jgi:uncharacterized caspase-like protein